MVLGSDGGGFNLGLAEGHVTIDYSGVTAGLTNAQRSFDSALRSIGGSISGIGDSLTGLGTSLTAITAPVALFGAQGLRAAADFDTLMRQIQIFGGVSPAELEKVKQAALDLGAATKFSSADAAAGMLDMLKAGMSLEDTMASLPAVMDLAAAGEMSLASAAGITTTALAQFSLKANDASRVSNALAQAANASRADVSDLGQGLANVGPIAAQFGLSIEDTAAILGVFSNNGIEGAEAGTQLRSMLNNLSRPTDNVKEAFEELGVSLYDADGNVRDFNTILLDLDTALDRLPMQRQIELTQILAGTYGQTGFAALRASGGITDMLAAMEQAPDAASVAAGFMDTFKGKMESLSGSIETFQIQVLTPFMNNTLAPFIDRMVEAVNAATTWAQENPELAQTITKVVAAVVTAGPALIGVGQVFKLIGTAISTLAPIIGLVVSPIGLIVAAIAGLALALDNLGFIDLGAIFETISSAIGEFIGAISAGVPFFDAFQELLRELLPPEVVDFLVGAFESIVGFIEENVLPIFQTLANWFILDGLPAIVTFVTTAVVPAIQSFFNFLAGVWEIAGPALGELFNWFVNTALPAILDFISGTVIPGVGTFIQVLTRIWNDVSPYLLDLFNWFINDALPVILDFITNTVIPGVQTFIDILVDIWEVVGPELEKLYNWFISEGLPAIKDFIVNEVMPRIQEFIDILEGIWTVISPELEKLRAWFVDTALPAVEDAIDSVRDRIELWRQQIEVLWYRDLKPKLDPIYNWFRDTFQRIKDFIQPVIDKINEIVGAAENALNMLAQLGGAAPGGSGINLSNLLFLPGGIFGGTQDSGGQGQRGIQYLIGPSQQGKEAFIPGADGQFIPDFQQEISRMVAVAIEGVGRGGGITVQPGGVVIQANSYSEGAEAGRGFVETMEAYMRERG